MKIPCRLAAARLHRLSVLRSKDGILRKDDINHLLTSVR
jgi:hypothetical protein